MTAVFSVPAPHVLAACAFLVHFLLHSCDKRREDGGVTVAAAAEMEKSHQLRYQCLVSISPAKFLSQYAVFRCWLATIKAVFSEQV